MTLPLTDPAALAEALIACPSVTPATGPVFDCLAAMLEPLGFTIERFIDGAGEPEGPVENLLAVRRTGEGPHLALPAISMSSRPARAGPATPSGPSDAARSSTGAARWI